MAEKPKPSALRVVGDSEHYYGKRYKNANIEDEEEHEHEYDVGNVPSLRTRRRPRSRYPRPNSFVLTEATAIALSKTIQEGKTSSLNWSVLDRILQIFYDNSPKNHQGALYSIWDEFFGCH